MNKLKKLRYRKFTSWPPKILILSNKQYLLKDLEDGCSGFGCNYTKFIFSEEENLNNLLIKLIQKIDRFKPDFVLMVNNLGLDREGFLLEFFTHIELPVLSWFVDNPFLFLPFYKGLESPYLVLASWDKDNISHLHDLGFNNSFHLPLAANLSNIRKLQESDFKRNVAFVGNSMTRAINKTTNFLGLSNLSFLDEAALSFSRSSERFVKNFLKNNFPDLNKFRTNLETKELRHGFDSLFYWISTQYYRVKCVKELLPFYPTISGDLNWKELLFGYNSWKYQSGLHYYYELPNFYASTAINFNTTSMQMKGALNQRVFDVPIAGSFVLTDYREQLSEMFKVGKEIICYEQPGEIQDLISYYLRNPELRKKICLAARKRIEDEHSYAHRIALACRKMTCFKS